MAEINVAENVENLNKDWHAFKEEHKKGRDADQTVLRKIEESLSARDAANQTLVATREAKEKALQDHINALEAKLNRAELGTGGGPVADMANKKAEQNAAFDAYLRFGHPDGAPSHRRADTEKQWARFKEEKGLSRLEWKVLTLGDDTGSGYLATPDRIMEIIKAEVLFSPMRSICRVRPTGKSEMHIPKRTGTASASWVGEIQSRPESTNPTHGLEKIPVHEMIAKVPVSRANAEDSDFDLQALLTEEFAEQFAVSEGNAIVVGNGVNKPMGFTDASQAVATTGTGGATIASASGAKGDAVVSLTYAVKSAYAQNGRFVLARQTLGSVRKLVDGNNRYLWEPSLAADQPSTILQYPYTEVPDMPLEGAGLKPIGFGDWKRAYTIADRLEMPMLRDDLTLWDSGQVKFAARRRVGGQVVLAEAIRLLVCT